MLFNVDRNCVHYVSYIEDSTISHHEFVSAVTTVWVLRLDLFQILHLPLLEVLLQEELPRLESHALDLVLFLMLIQQRLVLGDEAVFNRGKSLGELACLSDPRRVLSVHDSLHVF